MKGVFPHLQVGRTCKELGRSPRQLDSGAVAPTTRCGMAFAASLPASFSEDWAFESL